MRIAKFSSLLLAAVVLGGCANPKAVDLSPPNSVEIDGLKVTIKVPKRSFVTGEQFRVLITACNTTRHPIRIPAAGGAPVYVRIWRHTGLSWEEVKRYPEAATTIMTPWTLPAGQKWTRIMNLTVEPDWPTGELLRVTAELNGREDASPALTVEVTPPERS